MQSAAGTPHVRLAVGTGTKFPEFQIDDVLDDRWHHVVYTVTNAPSLRVRGYRDGVEVADLTTVEHSTIAPNDGELLFGKHFEITTRQYTGLLDEVMLFDRVITGEEVEALATPPKPAVCPCEVASGGCPSLGASDSQRTNRGVHA